MTSIDDDKSNLRYRVYPIEQLAEQATFLEVAYLLRFGELPTKDQYDSWVHDITFHTCVHENNKRFLGGFRYDALTMSRLARSVVAVSAFYSGAWERHADHGLYASHIRLR